MTEGVSDNSLMADATPIGAETAENMAHQGVVSSPTTPPSEGSTTRRSSLLTVIATSLAAWLKPGERMAQAVTSAIKPASSSPGLTPQDQPTNYTGARFVEKDPPLIIPKELLNTGDGSTANKP